ncbi:hypothetical protein CPLU01_00489 [Colletotrichum plurivorum]|uniref:Uncharacterized protein n=1 Tax=Colletotrichum plurivorum TaxID=2175906 RepID=A0A8H6NRT8_9PEZI|nr:hypothetical protein CPLU01_00489 [Colletotrichum plurivorum]
MISGRQYYEIPPAGAAGKAFNGNGNRFDPTYVPGYGHAHGYGRSGHYYDRNHVTVTRLLHDDEEENSHHGADEPTRTVPAARQSLSALDEKRANEIRRGVYAHVFLDVKNSSKSDVL